MTTLSEDDALRASIDHLRRQRAQKRGQVTKTQKKIQSLLDSHPDDWDPATIDELSEGLSSAVTAHDKLQSQINELLLDEAAYEQELAESEKHDDIHADLRLSLRRVKQQQLLWSDSHSLMDDMEYLTHSSDKTTPRFGLKLDSLFTNCRPLFNSSPTLRSHPVIKERIQTLRKALSQFSKIADEAASTPTTPPSSPVISTPCSHDKPKMAPLNLDIPKFTGDPLQWESFELRLKSLLIHRADGYSDIDKFAIITQAIVPAQGKTLVNDKMKDGASVPDLLSALRQMFGRPQLVIPILVQRVMNLPRTNHSATSIRNLKERVLDNYRALNTHIGADLDKFMPHYIRTCLEGKLKEDWERLLFEKLSEPTMSDFNNFIEQRLLWADTQAPAPTFTPTSTSSTTSSTTTSTSQGSHSKFSPSTKKAIVKCPLCSEAHWLGRCSAFNAMEVEERNKLVREKRLCLNCLSGGHTVKMCNNRHSCRHCSLRHHSALHRDGRVSHAPPATPTDAATVLPQTNSQPAPSGKKGNFVCTVVASLQHEGLSVNARILLDHGSGATFMSEDLASTLKLQRFPQDRLFKGFAKDIVRSKFYVIASLHSKTSDFVSKPIEFSVVPRGLTTPTPDDKDSINQLALENDLTLSDPDMGGAIDILLGGQLPWDFCGHVTSMDSLRFIHTVFGVGVTGPVGGCVNVLTVTSADTPLADDLSRLWELDRVPESSSLSPTDQSVLKKFYDEVTFKDNRISVPLPLKENSPPLGNSRKQALSRLYSNERSLSSKQKLQAFDTVLREYLTLGHAHIIPPQEINNQPNFYMPVHGVFKETSTTTKTRPVFDASAKSTSGYALNDALHVGPNLYPPLADILVKFRRHVIGVSADISKMFREILLNQEYRDLHRFLLRQPSGKIVDCRMERVTFGVASSPFLATQSLRYLAQLHATSHPQAANAINKEFYVDDYVSGADTFEEANQLRIELCDLLAKAGMTLRKWRSNSEDFLALTPAHLREEDGTALHLSQSQSPKALGIHWDVQTDSLHIAVPSIDHHKESKVTKRLMASISAGVFDILGLFAPAIIPARVLLQQTWKLNLSWDKPVPPDIKDKWNAWTLEIPKILSHAIPRRLTSPGKPVFVSLHGFSDASSMAYGAAVFLRAVQEDGSISSALVVAKARVLPVKHTTIPRAELLGAHLLAKLLAHTSNILQVSQLHAWTDSAIVLHWLSKPASQHADRFVANRVQNVQDLLPSTTWRHVPTQDNPADLASRGVTATELIAAPLWWCGPSWLSLPPDKWPVTKLTRPKEATRVLSISVSFDMDSSQSKFLTTLWSRFSSFYVLTRIIAWIHRFAHNSKKDSLKTSSNVLTSTEIENAKVLLFILAQQQSYPEVFSALKSHKALPKSHSLSKFIIIQDQGLLIAQSRVRNPRKLSQPIRLIPLHSKSTFTKLFCRTLHTSHRHPGISALHSIIASKFIIAGLRNLLKLISRSCADCQRAYARPLAQQMGLLPPTRTTPAPPFTITGVDFAGPFTIRQGHTRKPVLLKCYAVVFVCLTTKAIHLDLCTSLSTIDFRAALTRFIARRGCPSDIYSDNGTNFVGAREEIRELKKLLESQETRQTISIFAQENSIRWHHIPPRAPHFGGLWEAAVKAMKLLLRKNLEPHPLRYEELYTLLTESEAILNSRPIAQLNEDDTQQGLYLTAGHFIIGRPLKAPPTSEAPAGKLNSLRRWRLVARLRQDIWQQWLTSYLTTLSQRTKWLSSKKQLKKGDLVFVKDEVLKGRHWPIAIITETYPGDDNQVRAVKIKCRGKYYTRATAMLIPFIPDDSSLPQARESVWDHPDKEH